MHEVRPSASPRAARRTLWRLTAAVALLLAPLLALPQSSQRAQTEAELKAVRSEIARVRAKVNRDQIETDKATKELRAAEVAASEAREALDQTQHERADRAQARADLASQRQAREARITSEQAGLAGQMRAAYLIGRAEPLKLLLNQEDPAQAGRLLTYYGYFGRARAAELARVEADVHRLDELDEGLKSEEQRLADLETARGAELSRLDDARARRAVALQSIEAEARGRTQTLKRLQREQAGLASLLRELRRALQKFPIDSNDAFARLRGKLAWPVAGQLVARFGDTRAGAVKWDGVLIETERGAQVHAVYQGRVIFADWLPGLGLLAIIDHGDGYLSLYGHNERLFKAVGERVAAGDVIASAGDSGGSAHPELYFEIRKGGHPVDPAPWFQAAKP
jgi:septal ring factor EnvC (AmiA/AmiB activator)